MDFPVWQVKCEETLLRNKQRPGQTLWGGLVLWLQTCRQGWQWLRYVLAAWEQPLRFDKRATRSWPLGIRTRGERSDTYGQVLLEPQLVLWPWASHPGSPSRGRGGPKSECTKIGGNLPVHSWGERQPPSPGRRVSKLLQKTYFPTPPESLSVVKINTSVSRPWDYCPSSLDIFNVHCYHF